MVVVTWAATQFYAKVDGNNDNEVVKIDLQVHPSPNVVVDLLSVIFAAARAFNYVISELHHANPLCYRKPHALWPSFLPSQRSPLRRAELRKELGLSSMGVGHYYVLYVDYVGSRG